MLIIRGVNVFPSEMEHHLLELKELSPHYQLHLKKKGALDTVELHVEINTDFYAGLSENIRHDKIEELTSKVKRVMKNGCLVSMDVRVRAPKEIPRSEGKAIRIVDLRKEAVLP
jgi:phenylacetate-CoA ligase